jgi:hypothetical protein
MKYLKKVLILCVICVYSSSAYSQSNLINSTKLKERVKNEVLTYRMSMKGDSLGVTTTKYSIKKNIFSMSESVVANVNKSPFKETATLTYSLEESRLLSAELKMEMGQRSLNFSGHWNKENHIKLTLNKIDTILKPTQHVERFLSLFLLPRLIHDNIKDISYTQFNPMTLGFNKINALLKGKAVIDTPSGKTNCNMIELKGGVATQVIYIDVLTHRIVKIEIPALGWSYELIKVE